MNAKEQDHPLHIFVNRRRFDTADGVKPAMTGAEIAGLIDVPRDNAIVRHSTGPDRNEEVSIDQSVEIKVGDHFLVTRKVVEGGHDHRTNRL